MSDNATVRHDEGANRYVLEVDGKDLGFAEYRPDDDRRVFVHTEVDDSLEGKGMGSKLVREALDGSRKDGKRIVPLCSFVAGYIERHPDWNDIIDTTGR
jgi:predicted GNAT family acetyltransferase